MITKEEIIKLTEERVTENQKIFEKLVKEIDDAIRNAIVFGFTNLCVTIKTAGTLYNEHNRITIIVENHLYSIMHKQLVHAYNEADLSVRIRSDGFTIDWSDIVKNTIDINDDLMLFKENVLKDIDSHLKNIDKDFYLHLTIYQDSLKNKSYHTNGRMTVYIDDKANNLINLISENYKVIKTEVEGNVFRLIIKREEVKND